jgi:hypothetical protein
MATAVNQPTAAVPPIIDAEFQPEPHPTMALAVLRPIVDIDAAKQMLQEFQKFVDFYLVENEDYGKIPGIKKPSLWKSGADKLCEIYGLEETYTELRITEDWEKGLFDYVIQCSLTRNGIVRGVGVGSCSSYESKYRWRDAQRKCPDCQKESIIKSKFDDCGWFCFPKKGGCGAKFAAEDPAILEQEVGKVLNPDMADVKNTILKMAKKRAKVDATLAATRSSGIFTQDVEENGAPSIAPDRDDQAPVWDDMQPTAAAPVAAPAAKRPAAAAHTSDAGGEPISERDRKSLYQLMGRNGRSHDQLVMFLRSRFGIEAPTKITTGMFADVCLWAKGA